MKYSEMWKIIKIVGIIFLIMLSWCVWPPLMFIEIAAGIYYIYKKAKEEENNQ